MSIRNDEDLINVISKYGYLIATATGVVGLLTLLNSPIGLVIITIAVTIGILAAKQKGHLNDE